MKREMLVEWDYEKNGNLRPEDYTNGSKKKVWWLCKHGHSWQTAIQQRSKGRGCPFCAGRKVLVGYNDFASLYPYVAETWCYEKNGNLRPEDVTAFSNKKVWWECSRRHRWFAMINSRSNGRGCPYCSGRKVWIGFNDLPTTNLQLAMEWDYEKNGNLQPENFTAGSHTKIWWKCKQGHSWKVEVYSRKKNGCPYCANMLAIKGYNDLLSVAPKLCEEWDDEMNAPLRPDEIMSKSNKSVWWKCDKGHSWKSIINSRRSGCGCPVCAGKTVFAGYNDLQTLRPDIAEEWDVNKNGELLPVQVTSQSKRYAWWLCKRGHSYKAKVANRYHGRGCPYCAGTLPIVGETDLATIHPELLPEWDYDKNDSKLPEQYTACSNKKVWWKCKDGHSWQAVISDRHLGHRCPYCTGRNAISGVNTNQQ